MFSDPPTECDVVVIGSGIGGLCCAALLARYVCDQSQSLESRPTSPRLGEIVQLLTRGRVSSRALRRYGLSVTVLEAHDTPGGAAHAFVRDGYHFESGPSLYSGMRGDSINPLAQVFKALDVDLPCYTYNEWICHLPEGRLRTEVGAEQFTGILKDLRGEAAVKEWRALQTFMRPLASASVALPPAAFRGDPGVLLTAGRFLPSAFASLVGNGPEALKLTGPFSRLVDGVVSDPFIKNWLDLLCFLLSGLDAEGTVAAEMAFMFNEWFQPQCNLEFPVGGSQAMVDALVGALASRGGNLRLNARVEEIVLSPQGEATGVRVACAKGRGAGAGGDGKSTLVRARRAVVSNASAWDTLDLIPKERRAIRDTWRQDRADFEPCPSFMHLHAGIKASHLPSTPSMHHIWVGDWAKGVTAEQNVVLTSIPSVIDPSLAPENSHVIHAYT